MRISCVDKMFSNNFFYAEDLTIMANQFENENLSATYINVITSVVANCASKIKGVASVSNDIASTEFNNARDGKNNAVIVNLYNGLVVIDLYINVYYGFVIPKIVCELQEEIKKEVEKTTAYKIKNINVNIVGVLNNN
ncbi:MAG: Asp23/Gls24 family envelope stress response protein [Clostridia bacterium]